MKKKVLLFSAVLLVSATLVLNSCKKEIYLINEILHVYDGFSTGGVLDETPHSDVVFHYLSSGDFGSGMASNPYTSSDLSPYLPAVGDQGATGSCVAWAVAYNGLTALWHINNPGTAFSDANTFSPNFLYNNTKNMNTADLCLSGTNPVNAFSFLIDNGCATLSTDPLNPSGNPVDCDRSARPAAAYTDANKYQLDDFQRIVASSSMIKQKLCLKYPVVLGADLPGNFSAVNGGDYTLPTPDYSMDAYGNENLDKDKNGKRDHRMGHMMIIIGHDDSKQAFRVRNSWGADWGNNGEFWLPYSIVDDSWNAYANNTLNWETNPKFVNSCYIMELSHHHTNGTVTGGWDLDIDNLRDIVTNDSTIRVFSFDVWNNGDVATENNVKYEIWAYNHSTGEQTKLGEPINPYPAFDAGLELPDVQTEPYSTANLDDGSYSIVLCLGSYDTDASLYTRNDIRWHNNHAAIQLHVVNGEGILKKSNKMPKTKK